MHEDQFLMYCCGEQGLVGCRGYLEQGKAPMRCCCCCLQILVEWHGGVHEDQFRFQCCERILVWRHGFAKQGLPWLCGPGPGLQGQTWLPCCEQGQTRLCC